MKRWICWLLMTALLLGATALAADTPKADLVLLNGTIYTVDTQRTTAEALAISNGRISYVGTSEGARALIGGSTKQMDLGGKLVLPGLIDAHIHSIMPAFFDVALQDCFTLDELFAAIAAAVAARPDAASYSGFGYDMELFEGDELLRGPRKERLDAILPDKPIHILSYDGHTVWGNSKYFEAAGITKDTPSPMGGEVVKDPRSGALWGTLKDGAAALCPEVHEDSPRLRAALKEYQYLLNGLGYTGIVTLPAFGTMPVPLDSYRALEESGELSLRVHAAMFVMNGQMDRDIDALIEARFEGDMLSLRTAKLFLDGVVDTHTALLTEPYENEPDSLGMRCWDQRDLNRAVARLNGAGLQVHAHTIGDGALAMYLDALAYARDNAPAGDYRNTATHLQLVRPGDIRRMAELRVVAAVQTYWHEKYPRFWRAVERTALGARAEKMYPLKELFDAGITVAAASDYPVTELPNPFLAIRMGMTRAHAEPADEDTALWPEQAVGVEDMIRAFTINAAYEAFADDLVGSLEVGKAADLIVLDQNILALDAREIERTQVLQTYVGGHLVYDADW